MAESACAFRTHKRHTGATLFPVLTRLRCATTGIVLHGILGTGRNWVRIHEACTCQQAYIMHAYIQTHARTHARTRTRTHTCVYACIHACMHAYIHTYKHTNIQTYIHTYILHLRPHGPCTIARTNAHTHMVTPSNAGTVHAEVAVTFSGLSVSTRRSAWPW